MRRRFYFAYCEAAFDARYIHDLQVVWVKGDAPPAAAPAGGAGGKGAPPTLLQLLAAHHPPRAADPLTQVGPRGRQQAFADASITAKNSSKNRQ